MTDPNGAPIVSFKKDFGKSLIRSSWHLTTGAIDAYGTEHRLTVAVLRRVWQLIPSLGDIPIPFVFHFDFHR
ncbi:hypothetical protein [Mycobacterium hubeiense]|uniref:hypothetical protein n=1 Tax=Mycobacterium hubeiense TaxID=1867256 RepID=UPI0018EE2977|nr:hypothetical protein [Mycobacterium sp. QGD 101]